MTFFVRPALLLTACLLLAACAKSPVTSAFLQGTSLVPVTDGDATFWRRAMPIAPDAYTRMTLDPASLWLPKDYADLDISSIELRALKEYVEEAVYLALEQRFLTKNYPAPNTVRVSVGIIDVTPAPQVANTVTSVLPVAELRSFSNRLLTGNHPHVATATVAVILRDSMTGEPLAAFTHTRVGKLDRFFKTMSTTGDVEADLEEWSDALRERFDKAWNTKSE